MADIQAKEVYQMFSELKDMIADVKTSLAVVVHENDQCAIERRDHGKQLRKIQTFVDSQKSSWAIFKAAGAWAISLISIAISVLYKK